MGNSCLFFFFFFPPILKLRQVLAGPLKSKENCTGPAVKRAHCWNESERPDTMRARSRGIMFIAIACLLSL